MVLGNAFVRSLLRVLEKDFRGARSTITPSSMKMTLFETVRAGPFAMAIDEHRHALICEVAHDGKHFASELRVKRARRFIEEDNLRVCRNGAGNGNALLLTAGKLRGVIIVTVGEE